MATQYQIDLLADLLSCGKRICPDCGQEVNDPDNFNCSIVKDVSVNGHPIQRRIVCHITCPE